MAGVSRCGFVALCGKPNVGKSTLFNHLMGTPLAATTGKPQTTRHNIKGILTEAGVQFVFVDTPGIYSGRGRRLSRMLNANAREALSRVDVAAFLVESGVWNDRDAQVLEDLREARVPVILCANKIDRLGDQSLLLPYFAHLAEHEFLEYVPISARTGEGCGVLKKILAEQLPEREHLFDSKDLSDRHERFFVEELIREQLLVQLDKELPYASHVEVQDFKERGRHVHIYANILVERVSQRKIVLGRGGERIREIGTAARQRIEQLLERPVMLRLHVLVRQKWQQNPKFISSYHGGV